MALKKHLLDLGVVTKSHMSFIDGEVAEKIRSKFNEQINAEKNAEKERKRLIEMKKERARQAAHPEPEPVREPKPEPVPDIVIPQEIQESIKAADLERAAAPKPEPKPEPVPASKPEPKPEPKLELKPEPVAPQAAKPEPRPAPERREEAPRPYQPSTRRDDSRRPSDTGYTPRTGTGYQGRQPSGQSGPGGKRPYDNRKPAPAGGPRVAPVVPIEPPKPGDEEKKFGKAKVSHEELGDKSKHKKALITSTKKGKTKAAAPVTVDEAEVARSIKKTLQKSGKKKKYHREAQAASQERTGTEIVIREYTSVSELAKIMGVGPSEIISKFFAMGQLVTINQRLDRDSLEMICDEFKVEFRFEDEYGTDIIGKDKEQYDEVEGSLRPPVVTIMGHVDHGKTSILDYIRNTNVVAGESGSITQHIGAYQIDVNGHKITFLDTPGHEAFTAMRARGANATDIAVIVVSAAEGVKPQTKEAIDHAKAAGVSIIVAINKIDLPESNVDRVIAQLLEMGVYLEQYGGDVPWCKTSVVTGEGILNLIEVILLNAEMLELTARTEVPAEAIVIESEKDARMGAVATVLMREGSLKRGDIVVCGATSGRIRKMENERGGEIKELGPSDVARIYGLSDTPKAGDMLNQVDSEKTARGISTERQQIRLEREKFQNKSSLQNIFARIQENKINELNIILKADTDGSAEALADSFSKLSNDEVAVNIIHKSVGGISEADVSLASASDAIIIGFHVRASQQARRMAEDEGVEIKIYQIIYDAIDDIHDALEGMLAPDFEEVILGSATIKQVFKIKKLGTIAGCQVDKGVIRRGSKIRVYRNDVLMAEDDLSSLKHYSDDVKEVKAGTDCGLSLAKFTDIKEGDVLECYTVQQVAKKL